MIDWAKEDLKARDESKWPPANAALSDLVIYKIITAEVSVRNRTRRWPSVFQSSGLIITTRLNIGSDVNLRAIDGKIYDAIFKKSYILHGDLGAFRKGGPTLQKTGDRSGVEKIKGREYFWTFSPRESSYDLTTEADRYLHDVVPLAQRDSHRMGSSTSIPYGVLKISDGGSSKSFSRSNRLRLYRLRQTRQRALPAL